MNLFTVEDPWGSWGGMREEPDSWMLDTVREVWGITNSRVLEKGPERARLLDTREGGGSAL
ncbi:MAG: hypothetical protein WD708_03600 [Kiritimatiellia bacterium]